jgi:hypothetical protein
MGEGRAVTKHHQPKKHEDLLLTGTIPTPLPEDNTKYRVLGNTQHPLPRTENYQYLLIYKVMAKESARPITFQKLEKSTSS